MFTGIVQGLIKVKSLIRKEEFCTLVLSFPEGKQLGWYPAPAWRSTAPA